MATYTGTAPQSLYAYFKLDMSVISQSEADNTSRIRYRLYLESRGGGSGYSQTKRATSLICNNQTIENTTTTYSFDKGGSSTLCSGTFTIKHNSDGTMSFPIKASVGTHRGTCSLSATMTLPTIARKKPMSMSIVDSVADTVYYANIGDSVTINVTNISGRSGSIRWETDNYSGYVGSLASSTHFTFSSSTFSDVFGSESSGYVTFTASADDGTTASRTITLRIFEIKKPSISYVSVSENNSQVKSVFGSDYFYTNISDVSAYVSAEAYGASIEKYLATLDGYTTYSDSSTIDIGSVTRAGERNITFEVVDSRNQRKSYGQNIRVKEYNPPTAECSVTRHGEGLNASVKVQHTVSGSTDKNTCNVTVDVRELPYGSFSTKYSANINIASTTQSVSLGSGYKEFASYEVRVTATDKFRSYTALVTVPTQSIGIAINPKNNSVGIGKFPDDKLVGNDNLEVKGDIFAQGIEADLTLKAWKADIDYLNIKKELKIDGKEINLEPPKPFASYNTSERLDTNSTRDLFGIADLGEITYPNSLGNGGYSDIITIRYSPSIINVEYIGATIIRCSGLGMILHVTDYGSNYFKVRIHNYYNRSVTSAFKIAYHIRGSI